MPVHACVYLCVWVCIGVRTRVPVCTIHLLLSTAPRSLTPAVSNLPALHFIRLLVDGVTHKRKVVASQLRHASLAH